MTTTTDTMGQYWELEPHHHPEGASTSLGFWVYLMSDCLIFAMLFAVYGVIGGNYAGGPGPKDLFELPLVALNTSMLLLSSITYGFAMLAMSRKSIAQTQIWLAITDLWIGALIAGRLQSSFSTALITWTSRPVTIPLQSLRIVCSTSARLAK